MNAQSAAGEPVHGLRRWVVDPVLRASIATQSAFVDARFVYQQGLPATLLSRALSYPARAWERLRLSIRDERQDLLYARYARLPATALWT